jgi:hypothetical protein
MAALRAAIFWVLCPKQNLHCYIEIFLKPQQGVALLWFVVIS